MRKGFTLLELLTVVIIVAILSSLAVPQFFRVAERARSAEATAAMGAIRSAQMRYYAEHAIFTDDVDELDVDVGDFKYFDDPLAVAGAANNADATIAQVTRNNTSYTGGAPYTVQIDQEGDIWCTGNNTVCAKIGLPTADPN